MTILQALIFAGISLSIAWAAPAAWRAWLLALASLLALYWLQPATPIRHLDFWLPTASIFIVVLVWLITQKDAISWRENRADFAGITLLVAGVGLTRYTGSLCCLTPTRPPSILFVGFVLLLAGAATFLLVRLPRRNSLSGAGILLILTFFVVLKSERLGDAASAFLRQAAGQDPSLASALDLGWLGYSYLAFRLLHVLRDLHTGKTAPSRLHEFIAYALFYPALTAGPLDRVERFLADLRTPLSQRDQATAEGLYRIVLGLFKKFVLADSLALVALNSASAAQVSAGFWAWVLLYAYSFRLFWDFSGYTDLALGIARLVGLRLPENFSAPYLKSNLTAFWNSWHITLAQWFRAYFFNPFTRSLRTRQPALPAWIVILAGQLGTMLLIGLWHGLTWNYAIWGLWHGMGLFAHNRWSAWTRAHVSGLPERSLRARALALSGWLLTFNYVTLGWVWFALPSPALSWLALGKLFGFSV
jgi:alginate O-acetyltransferase complex protein AlgI